MSRYISQLWEDDSAAVLSTELILILGIVVFGIIPGLVAIRNSTVAALGTIGNLISVLTPAVTFSQVSVAPTQYQVIVGLNITTGTVVGVSTTQVDPVVATVDPVTPAP